MLVCYYNGTRKNCQDKKCIYPGTQAEHDKEVASLQASATAARDAAQEELARLNADLAERLAELATVTEEAACLKTRASGAEAALSMPCTACYEVLVFNIDFLEDAGCCK
jgi:hypothetical protein